jgi:hypothetical protein
MAGQSDANPVKINGLSSSSRQKIDNDGGSISRGMVPNEDGRTDEWVGGDLVGRVAGLKVD